MKKIDFYFVDDGIRPAVEILNKHGFKTFESCQGGEGHFVQDPFVSFEGEEFDLIRAYEICDLYNLCVLEARRVFSKTPLHTPDEEGCEYMGEVWDKPHNEIVFLKHDKTGTIFRPD